MNKLLILTKNILAEQQLQKQLQLLDYEMFCSTEAFKEKRLYSIFDYFPIILLSETIRNREIGIFLQHFDAGGNLIVRLIMEPSNEGAQSERHPQGIDGELVKTATLDAIREKLFTMQSDYYGQLVEKNSQICAPIQKWDKRTLKYYSCFRIRKTK